MKRNKLLLISRTILLIMALFWFVFALLSGAGDYGGGIKGIILNSPNALPWLLLLVLVYMAFKWELLAGILISLMGVLTIFAFNTLKHLFILFVISLPLISLGGALIFSHFLSANKKKKRMRL